MYGIYPANAPQSTMTGSLVRNSAAYPSPSTGAMTMDDVKQWMEKTGPLNVANKYWAMGGAALAIAGLAYYGHKNYWF